MAQPLLLTLRDAIEHLTDYCSGNSLASAQRDIRRCVHAAYREIATAHDWQSAYKHGRVQIHAAYSTGTVEYDHAGGTYERQLTLTDGTWPTWAQDAYVRVGDLVCAVESRKSNTVLTLDVRLNPGADVAAATEFSIYPAYYILPYDFLSFSGPFAEESWRVGTYVRPEDWMALDRYRDNTGDMVWYTLMNVGDLHGNMGLYIHPPSDAEETIDFIYKARPRQLRYTGLATADTQGTVTINADSDTITGTGTAFDDGMEGSVIRLAADATNLPTGWDGLYPFAEERVIVDVADAATLSLDRAVTTARTAVKYVISDGIDIDQSAYDAFLRCCEKHLAIMRNMKNQAAAMQLYQEALFNAKGADARVTQRMVAGGPVRFYQRLADMPQGADVE